MHDIPRRNGREQVTRFARRQVGDNALPHKQMTRLPAKLARALL